MPRRVLAAGLLVALLPGAPAARAEPQCSFDTACVEVVWERRSASFMVTNLVTYDITVTIELDGDVSSDVELPVTETVPGGETVSLVTVSLKKGESLPGWSWWWIQGSIHAEHDDDHVYALPYTSGETYQVIQGFDGEHSHYGNDRNAIDFAMPVGTEILAARSGVVVGLEDGFGEGGPDESYRRKANFVKVEHQDGTVCDYLHLEEGGVAVALGQEVEAGDLLGYSGNSGYSTTPHLHIMVSSAIDGQTRETYAISYETDEGPEILVEGESYTAP